MPNYLNEMENEGLIVIGRVVQTEFDSAAAIERAADRVSELATEHGLPLGFVYAGTTGNWPDQFEYTSCLVGIVTHVDYGSDEADGAEPDLTPMSTYLMDLVMRQMASAVNALAKLEK